MLLPAWWSACVHETPPELRLDSPAVRAEIPEPTDPAARLRWMVGTDPLLRRPRLPAAELGPPLAEWQAAAREPSPRADRWWAIEATRPGSLAVPLARGARLAAVEPLFPNFEVAISWIVPLPAAPVRVEAPRPALDWLQPSRPEDVLAVLERQVLLGWLDGPEIPVELAAEALAAPTWARLAQSPAGMLLLAAAAETGTGDPAAMQEATRLALIEVAADSDAEQRAWRELRGAGEDPVNAALRRVGLDGRSDAGVGHSLLAQAALRWRGACADAPCGGMDRVSTLRVAARWSPEVAPLARAWQVIALKDAVDQLHTTYDTSFGRVGVDRLVEVLVGLGVGGLDQSVLQHRDLGPPLHLAICRALGAGDLTSKDAMFRTLNLDLAARAEALRPDLPPELQEPLGRIARRARAEAR